MKLSKFQEVYKVSSKFGSLRSRYGRDGTLFNHRGGTEGHSMWSCSGSSMKFGRFTSNMVANHVTFW